MFKNKNPSTSSMLTKVGSKGDHLHTVIHDPVVKVLPSQVCVPGCGLDLKDSFTEHQQGHIKGAATQIKDQNGTGRCFAVLHSHLVQPKCHGSGCGFVEDAQHMKARDLACILGRLTLSR
jgi:NAD-specific glutamate dehydrogenase